MNIDADFFCDGAQILQAQDRGREQVTDVIFHNTLVAISVSAGDCLDIGRYYLLSRSGFQIRLEHVDRVNIDGPAYVPRSWHCLDLRYQAFDQTVQTIPPRALQ